MAALGFLTIYRPTIGAIGIVAVSATAFLVSGISSILLAFQLKSFKTEIEKEAKKGFNTSYSLH